MIGGRAGRWWVVVAVSALAAGFFGYRYREVRAGPVVTSRYDSYGDAADAGEVRRGWLAGSVPADATDLVGWHDLDTAECYGVFTLARSAALDPSPPPDDFLRRVAEARRVHPADARLARVQRSRDLFVACHDSGKDTSIVAVIARDAEAGVYWCRLARCQ